MSELSNSVLDLICRSTVQSGNTVQVGIALAQLYAPVARPGETKSFHITDYQALCSLLSFLVGSQLSRLFPGSKKSRIFAMLWAFIQGWCLSIVPHLTVTDSSSVLLTGAAALAIHYSGEPTFSLSRGTPSWSNADGFITLGLLAFSFGMQGTVAEMLGSNFTSTVVVTSICKIALLEVRKCS